MSELRWNPLLGTWTMVASNRKLRPTMPKDWCPFCPGEGKRYHPNLPCMPMIMISGSNPTSGSTVCG